MEFKLGLCKLPEPIYLYVRNGEEGGNSFCWYYHNPDTKINTPEHSDGLCGYLSELRITTKEYKGKENIKLDIVISAGETYIIRSGIETNFSKSFLLAIALVEDLSKPLIIGCSAGKENVVFCNIYDAVTKARVRAEWDASADWATIIDKVQFRLSGQLAPQTPKKVVQTPPPHIPESRPEHAQRVMAVRVALGIDQQVVRELLKPLGIDHPQYLSKPQCDAFIMSLALRAVSGVLKQEEAIASYERNVPGAIAKGANESDAVYRWVSRVLDAEAEGDK